jgi:hypothetical protein
VTALAFWLSKPRPVAEAPRSPNVLGAMDEKILKRPTSDSWERAGALFFYFGAYRLLSSHRFKTADFKRSRNFRTVLSARGHFRHSKVRTSKAREPDVTCSNVISEWQSGQDGCLRASIDRSEGNDLRAVIGSPPLFRREHEALSHR